MREDLAARLGAAPALAPRRGPARLVAMSMAVLLLWAGCVPRAGLVSQPAQPLPADGASSLEALMIAMGQRLALMPRVAEWKRARSRPVRDLPRERQVLDQAVAAMASAARRAGAAPFSEAAVRRFYRAQIDAAVGIQERILSGPPGREAEVPDLVLKIRPELDRLGSRIADLAVAQSQPPDASRLERLAQRHWRVEGLEAEAVSSLLEAVMRLWESGDD
ncbi:MAG: chorismate mutase [Acidobacteriota bacterium]